MKEGIDKNSNVSKRIREFRKIKNMTQMEIADKIGISRSAYAQIEQGKIPSRKILERISTVLNTGSLLFIESNESKIEDEKDTTIENKIQDLISDFSLLCYRNFKLARNFLRAARQAEEANEDGDQFMLDIANEKWEEVRLLYSGALIGTIDLKETSSIEIWGKLLSNAKESVLATSCLSPAIWWSSPMGQWYQRIILERMKKGGLEMERIFILSSKEKEENKIAKEIIKEQKSAGIKIWVGYNLPPGLGSDFYVIDDYYIGWLYVREREAMEGTRFSNNIFERSRAKRIFEAMKINCKEIKNTEDINLII